MLLENDSTLSKKSKLFKKFYIIRIVTHCSHLKAEAMGFYIAIV